MNSLLLLSRIGFSIWVFISLTTCAQQQKSLQEEAEWSPEVYTILAEKAMTLQADFNMVAWADMLSDDIEYMFPADGDSNQTKIVGKAAVLTYWQTWQRDNGIQSLSLSGFNHAPYQSTQKLPVMGLSGVHVFSLVSSRWVLTNGQTILLPINFCCHFNQDRHLDRCAVYYDRTPIAKAACF